jgi:predicted metal-dependent peptidase
MAKKAGTMDTPEIDYKAVLVKMQAARVTACRKMPYLSTALFAMVMVRADTLFSNGTPTLASDAKWRLYYNPLAVNAWTVEQLSGAILHEVNHCLRAHSARFKAMGENPRHHKTFNYAADSVINEDLREDKVILPPNPVYVETLVKEGVPVTREMTSEAIYYLLRKKSEESCTCNKPKPDDGKQGKQNQKDQKEKGKPDKQDAKGQEDSEEEGNSKGKGKGDSDEEGDSDEQGNSKGKGKGDSDEEGDSDEQGNSKGKGDSKGQGQGSGRDPNCPEHGDHDHQHSADGSGEPCPYCEGKPDCGSAADGVVRDYEVEGDKVDAGIDEARAELVRRGVANEILEASKNRGTVSAGLVRWAQDLVDPVVDWRKELASIIRKTFASVSGLRDYTYKRPSRRQTALNQSSGSKIIYPAMRQPAPPQISIVIDTSGSMSDEMLNWALSEAKAVLATRGSTNRAINVISCDARATTQKVTNISQVQLVGAGGTDMRVGIKETMEQRPKPDAVIVISDGFTPWPDAPLKGTTLIVALTDESSLNTVPDWARKVLIVR